MGHQRWGGENPLHCGSSERCTDLKHSPRSAPQTSSSCCTPRPSCTFSFRPRLVNNSLFLKLFFYFSHTSCISATQWRKDTKWKPLKVSPPHPGRHEAHHVTASQWGEMENGGHQKSWESENSVSHLWSSEQAYTVDLWCNWIVCWCLHFMKWF